MITCERISSNFAESISCSGIPHRVWNLNVRGCVHKGLSITGLCPESHDLESAN